MATTDESVLDGGIESQILSVFCEHPRLTFTCLADAFPEHRWRELIGGLEPFA